MSESMLPLVNYYYKSSEDENCISFLSKFFESMQSDDFVVARFNNSTNNGIGLDKITNIGNHLSSSKCWSSVEDWCVDVEYTIDHPGGEILVSDNKIKNNPSANRKDVIVSRKSSFTGSDTVIEFERYKMKKAECVYTNMTKSSFVKITRTKKFIYSTKHSSWIYKLCVLWEGNNKEEAEISERKYYVTIETDDTKKASANVKYTTVSFLEKVLDMEFIRVNRKTMNFF